MIVSINSYFLRFFSFIGYGPLFEIVHVASSTQVAAGMYLYTYSHSQMFLTSIT